MLEDKIWKMLSKLAEGRRLDEALRYAGMSVGEAELAISYLVAEGYMVELGRGYECICDKCPLRRVCVAPVSFEGRTYAIVRLPKAIGKRATL